MGETSENQNPLVSQATSLLLQSFMQQPAMTGGSSNQTVSSSTAEFQAECLEKWKQQREDFDKIFSHRDVPDLLLHAFQCELMPCQDLDCLTVKQMYRDGIQSHGIQCTRGASGGCVLCTKMRYFLGIHARNCRKEFCYVPLCSYWKWSQVCSHPLQTFPSPQFSQPLQTFPRSQFSQPLQNFARSQPILPGQAVAMGMAKQRAAEAGPGFRYVMAEQIRIVNQRPVLQAFQTPIDWKKQVEDFDKTFSEHRDVLELMVHAFQCELPQCQDPDCAKMKGLYRDGMQSHGVYCTTRSLYGRCDLCTKMHYFLQLHAQNCRKEFCYVPHCSYHKVRTQAAPMEMTRKRAAEAVPDTMDEHQLNRSDQNPLKSQKICMGTGKVCKENSIPSSTESLTKSTSLTETVNGSHQFKITGYSLLKGLGVGKYIASDTFSVGGYEWAIYFYPDGKNPEDNAAFVSCFIALASEGEDVGALFELTILDQSGKEMHKVYGHFGRIPENGPFTLKYRGSMWGYKRLFRRTFLETSDYLKDDCLIIQCSVGVVKSYTEGPKICSISMENSMSEHSCQLCGAKELTSEPPSGHVSDVPAGPKRRLQKKKDNEETDEWWVKCDKCEAWQHQKNEGKQQKYTCTKCYIGEVERGERTPSPQTLGAKDLPKTTLSDHIELRLFKRLRQEKQERARFHGKSVDQIQGAESLTVRVVSSIDKMLEVNPRFLEILQQENYPSELPYKSKVILLFQEIEGVEVCLFGMQAQEFGSECQNPNNRAVYISYLDSVKYFKPEIRTVSGEALRTFVYHEFLIGYLEYCKLRGFTSCYIWACPPLKDDEYIFYCHPEIQKTPESDKLREWLQAMLRKASKENIVTELTNLYDHFFISAGECKAKVTASRLPYFDGDFWPGAAGDIINQLQQTYVQTDISANDSKDDVLMQRLGETIRPMKEDFIVVHLQHSCNHCRKLMVSGNLWVCNNCSNFQLCDRCYGVEQNLEDRDKHPINSKHKHVFHPVEVVVAQDTKDKDVILDCEYFDTRQSFVALCRGNHYQFDTLRRAKHSSMMVLYHIHNPTSIAFAATCNMCQQDTEAGQIWRCNVCPHYDVCNSCFQKDGGANHPHQLTIHTSTAQVRDIPDFLVHAFQCELPQCLQYRDCLKIKALFRHGTQCKIRVQGGCLQCKKMCHLFRLHARNCKAKLECCVPHCRDIKDLLKRLQEQFDTRRRVAMMEMIRQQAEETVLDKMGHLSVADNVVDTVDEEDYDFAEVVVDKMGHLSIAEPVLDKIGEHQSVDDDDWICI